MEVLLLGPVAVVEGDRAVTIRQRRQRALLALLALRAGETVPVDRLVEDFWGADAPRTAVASLHNAVSQLRKLLGPEIVVTRDPGYAVDGDVSVDVARFEDLLAEARSARSMPDEETAAAILREALALWRGPALADLAYEPFAQAEIRRLEELRQGALEERVDAELSVGRHADLVPELEALVAQEPLRERLHGQLMLALYRSERQADALAAYRAARTTLVDELGIDEDRREPAELHRRRGSRRQGAGEEEEGLVLSENRGVELLELGPGLASGSTDEADPETLHAVLGRFFEVVDAVVSGHGGVTERMAGDAVMAAFGVSTGDENPAVRAVRAAADIRSATAATESHGSRLDVRVGIATGEVLVSGAGSRRQLVTGEAIAVAADLQRIAAPGQVVIGPLTQRLAGDAATLEPVGEVDVPSRTKPVAAFTLVEVSTEQPTIGSLLDTPLVGRKAELRTLRAALRAARPGPSVHAVCLIGPAGIGKSRLAREVVRGARGFDVLIGRCPSYGQGITYWPLRQIVGDDTEAIAAILDDRRAAELLVRLEGPAPEIAWAFQRWCEARAERRPVLIAVDDLHWAEPTFLDLLEHLVDHGSGRIGLLVLARDELLEGRPDFLDGRSTRVQLEGLAVAETEALIEELLGGAPLPDDVRARLFETAEGNPLFVVQLVALAAEGDTAGPDQQVPATIQALLAARLDRLGPGERAVLERAAVIGREFTAGHVTALLEPAAVPTAGRDLASLTRRAFVQVRSSGDYRFRHGLVQDATYRATPKRVRAELHERLADRLDREGETGDALVGYHLERAYRLRTELAPADRATLRLAEDAGRRLGLAGIRAWKRHDAPAASSLLGRAVDLLPAAEPRRLELLRELATVRKWTMDDRDAEVLLDEVAAIAREAGSERFHLRAEIERAWPRFTRGEASSEEIVSLATRAIWVFEADGDDRAAGRAWIVLAATRGPMQLRFASCEAAAERALAHYERAGYSPTPCFSLIASAATYGPTPVSGAVERCEALLASRTSDRSARAHMGIFLAQLEVMRGDLARARGYLATSRKHVLDQGGFVSSDWVDVAARLARIEGDTSGAEALLEEQCARLGALGDRAWVATFTAALAEVAYDDGRYTDARAQATRAAQVAPNSDLLAQVTLRRSLAKAAARLGELDEARRLATEACALLSGSDALADRAAAALDLAEVLHLASRRDEAAAPADEALSLFAVKGDRTGLERAQRRLAGLASLTSG